MRSMETSLLRISEAPIDQPPDIQVKLWAKAVRDLSYGLEDSIDKFMVRIETDGRPDKSHNFWNFIDKSLSLLTKGKIRHKISIDIKDIKSRIKEVSDRRDRYKVDNVAAAKLVGPAIDTLRLAALYRKAKELVGTDEKSVEMYQNINEASWGEQQLISEIRTFLENKRYLIMDTEVCID
uniref:Disease resistance N-terminal domain-containing protein n=1 Tax=Aegilops tauschii TaxID=37682 RepID=N1R247_AEGTA